MNKSGRHLEGATIHLPESATGQTKVMLKFSLDESTLAKIKQYHIRPSTVFRREIKREIKRRERAAKAEARVQVVNRYTGEVLPSK